MRVTQVLLQIPTRYWRRYVEREMRKVTGVDVWRPLQGWKSFRRKRWRYTEQPPWTDQNKMMNESQFVRYIPLEPVKEWMIFKGDRVEVMVGDDTGKQGIVDYIVKERNWCFVQGLHCVYRTQGATNTTPPVMMRVEKPLLVTSEVKLVDPSDEMATDVVWRENEDGSRVRISTRTGREVPLPSYVTVQTEGDDVDIKAYKVYEGKDTPIDELKKITFQPKLSTFESDIMESMGIKEERKPAKTYWY